MKDIRNLFSKRDKTHLEATNEIALEIQFVFHGILEFFKVDASITKWGGLEFSDDILVVHARVTVNEETQRVLRVGLPIDLILKESKEEIIEFLKKTAKEAVERREAEEKQAQELVAAKIKEMMADGELDEDVSVSLVPVVTAEDRESGKTMPITVPKNRTLH